MYWISFRFSFPKQSEITPNSSRELRKIIIVVVVTTAIIIAATTS